MRIYGDKTMEDWQMQHLAKALRQAGFTTAAVGRNYIEFYNKMEIRRLADAVLHERGGSEVSAPGADPGACGLLGDGRAETERGLDGPER